MPSQKIKEVKVMGETYTIYHLPRTDNTKKVTFEICHDTKRVELRYNDCILDWVLEMYLQLVEVRIGEQLEVLRRRAIVCQ